MVQSDAPPIGRRILTSDEMRRALVRISHEILERNGGADDLVLMGLHTRGVPIARRIAEFVKSFEGNDVPVGSLDIGLYRDDLAGGARPLIRPTDVPAIQGLRVVLVDDVLYTGRSIRAAMDALTDFGRPSQIQHRSQRELPLRADYVGKNVPTSNDEEVDVKLIEIDDVDEVLLSRKGDA